MTYINTYILQYIYRIDQGPITETWVKDELMVAEARWADVAHFSIGLVLNVGKSSGYEQTCTPRMNGSKREGAH